MNKADMLQFAIENSFGHKEINWPDAFFDLSETEQQAMEAEFWKVSRLEQCDNCGAIDESHYIEDGYCEDCQDAYSEDFEEED